MRQVDDEVTESGRRIPCLDGWRGLAILFVLAGHFSPVGWLGVFGVELFFVLSGRLMASILVGQGQPLRTFAARRALRILPALVVFVALASLAGAVGDVPTNKLIRGATAALLFFSNYLVGGILTIFQHTWSLAVEEHSYMLLAVITLLTGRKDGRTAAVALCLAGLLMMIAAIRWNVGGTPWLYMHSESRAASILLSFAIAVRAPDLAKNLPSRFKAWIAPALFAAALTVIALRFPPPVSYTLGTLLLALAVNFVEHSHPLAMRVLGDPILRWFGIVSFSLYLWQQPFYQAHVLGVSTVIALPVALMLGAASYYLVEVPSRRFFRPRERAHSNGATGNTALFATQRGH